MPTQPDNRAEQPTRTEAAVEQPADTAQREGADIAGAGAAASATTPPARGPVLIVAAHPDDPEFGLGATRPSSLRKGGKSSWRW